MSRCVNRKDQPLYQRAFTLMEITVVLFVLVVIAALVIPKLANMITSQTRRAAYGHMVDAARQARQMAINDGTTYALNYDSGQNQLVVLKQQPPDTSADAGTIPPEEARPLTGVEATSDLQQVNTVQIPSPITLQSFQLNGKQSDSATWLLHFYPDGTSDGGGFQIGEGSQTYSVLVDPFGIVTFAEGMMPDPSDTTWPAGTYEQKI